MWLDNPCLSASWGESWVGIHSRELWAVDVQSRPTQDGMSELQALGKDSIESRSCSASVQMHKTPLSFCLEGDTFHWRPQLLEQFVEGVTTPLSVKGRALEKSPRASISSSPPHPTFALLLSYIHAHCHFSSKTGLERCFVVFLATVMSFLPVLISSKFVIIPLPSPERSLLSLAVLGLATHHTSCRDGGGRADSLTFHVTLSTAIADNATRASSHILLLPSPGKAPCVSGIVSEGRESGTAHWTILSRSAVYGPELLLLSLHRCVTWCISLDTCHTSAENITSHLSSNQSAERLQSWDVPELTQTAGSGGANWPWATSTETPGRSQLSIKSKKCKNK